MRPVHIAGFGSIAEAGLRLDEAEMVQRVVADALADAGLSRTDVGFWCSGSNDYVMGRAFSFTLAIDGIGPWPPVRESHVEMDGAWALYEAWVRLQHGDVDVAVVYGFGKSTLGSVDRVRTLELDPYTVAPLNPDPASLAALQARVLLDRGLATEADFDAVAARTRGDLPTEAAYVASPLKAHHTPSRTDGAAAIVLSVDGPGPRIAGLEHRIDAHQLGFRDLAISRSAQLAGEAAGVHDIDHAELYAPYAPQEIVLRNALGLSPEALAPNRALDGEIPMVTGLANIGRAANAVRNGASRALGHATAGPCLQHNLVCVLEGS